MKKIELGTIALLIAVISMVGACVVIAPADSSVARIAEGDATGVDPGIIDVSVGTGNLNAVGGDTASEKGCFMTAEFVFTQMFGKIAGLLNKIPIPDEEDTRGQEGAPIIIN